jgi:hypothetical protein
MKILGGLFRDNEVETLKAELVRQTARVEHALQELDLSQKAAAQNESITKALNETNASLLRRVIDLQVQADECAALRQKIANLESDLLQAWEQEAGQKAIAEQFLNDLVEEKQRLDSLTADLRKSTEAADELKAENFRISRENQELRSGFVKQEQLFKDREKKLQEKSQKLIQQQVEISARYSEISAKEQYWKLTAQPQLQKFEAYCSLEDQGKQLEQRRLELVDMSTMLSEKEHYLESLGITASSLSARAEALNLRAVELADQESKLIREKAIISKTFTSIEMRAEELKARSQELSKFQKRIDRLDVNSEALKKLEKSLNQRESRYLEDLKEKRKELREKRALLLKEKNRLKIREDAVSGREREADHARKQLEASNIALREQLAVTNTRLSECLATRSQIFSTTELRKETRVRTAKIIDADSPLPPISKPTLALRSNSPLTVDGYHVGDSGISDERDRRDLLKSFIAKPLSRLSKVGNSEYMKLWGEGDTRIRIRYVAYHIYWNIEFQGAKKTMNRAREHWLKDLRWLKREYVNRLPANYWPEIPK